MSSGMRFEKTFTRKKKEINIQGKITNGVKEDEHTAPSESSSHQQTGKSENSNQNSCSHSKSTVFKNREQPTIKIKFTPKIKKEDNNGTMEGKKKKCKEKNDNDLLKPKQKKEELKNQDETQKQKRKLENGVGDFDKDEVLCNLKKPKKSKNQRKGKEDQKGEISECAFPANRILRIVKSEVSSDCKLSGEAVFLINKATEKFIELFSNDAYDFAVEDRKRFVGYKHLASAVCKKKLFDFLSDYVPEKVAAEKALAERKPAETTPLPC